MTSGSWGLCAPARGGWRSQVTCRARAPIQRAAAVLRGLQAGGDMQAAWPSSVRSMQPKLLRLPASQAHLSPSPSGPRRQQQGYPMTLRGQAEREWWVLAQVPFVWPALLKTQTMRRSSQFLIRGRHHLRAEGERSSRERCCFSYPAQAVRRSTEQAAGNLARASLQVHGAAQLIQPLAVAADCCCLGARSEGTVQGERGQTALTLWLGRRLATCPLPIIAPPCSGRGQEQELAAGRAQREGAAPSSHAATQKHAATVQRGG
jgi:hypothetical protein